MKFHFRTWYAEYAVVLTILVIVAVASGNRPVEWIGVLAVFFTFAHASVANRMEEREAFRAKMTGKADVHCYHLLTRWYLLKEMCWFLYFFLVHAYSALIGGVLFLIYPYWRKYWRRIHPFVVEEGRQGENVIHS